jgi:hypothetical protein
VSQRLVRDGGSVTFHCKGTPISQICGILILLARQQQGLPFLDLASRTELLSALVPW